MAVWLRSNKDNFHTFLLSFTVLLSSLSYTVSAPIEEEPWWTHPCTGQVTVPQYRHARSGGTHLTPLDIQFEILRRRMQEPVFKELEELYQKKPQTKMGTCPKINAVLNLLKKMPRVKILNHIFYESIVELAKFVHMMKITDVTTEAKFDHDKRREIYHNIEVNLRNVLCEYNETLKEAKPLNKKSVQRIRNLLSTRCIPKSMDLTGAQLLDYDVLKKLRRFFVQGRRILNRTRQNRRKERKNNINANHKKTDNKKVQKSDKSIKRHQKLKNGHNNKRTKHKKNSASKNQ